jgi:hypothetical protein
VSNFLFLSKITEKIPHFQSANLASGTIIRLRQLF